jgi:hypothetical protein
MGYNPITDELTQAAMTTWAAKDLPARLLAAQVVKLLNCTPESHATDPNTLRIAELNLSKTSSQLNADQQLEVDQRMKNFQPIPVIEIDPMPVGWQKKPSYQQEDGEYGH